MSKKDPVKKKERSALEKLLLHALKDMYSAEGAIHKALVDMAGAAKLPSLQAALTAHCQETADRTGRLEKVFELFGAKPKAVPCEAIKGILTESANVLDQFGDTEAADAAAIFCAQAIKHYEITRYGTLREWARELGATEAARILSELLDQEYAADQMLTKIAEDRANKVAEGAIAAE